MSLCKPLHRYRRSTYAAWPFTGLMGTVESGAGQSKSSQESRQDTLFAFEQPSVQTFEMKGQLVK